MRKQDIWKIATIVLFLLLVALVVRNHYQNKKINLAGVEIPISSLEAVEPFTSDTEWARICDLKGEGCIMIQRVS